MANSLRLSFFLHERIVMANVASSLTNGPSNPKAAWKWIKIGGRISGQLFDGAVALLLDAPAAYDAGADAVEAIKRGNYARAKRSGLEAALWTISAGSGLVGAVNIWNPLGWGSTVLCVVAGGAAIYLQAQRESYDEKVAKLNEIAPRIPTLERLKDPLFSYVIDPEGNLSNFVKLYNDQGKPDDVVAAFDKLTEDQITFLKIPDEARQALYDGISDLMREATAILSEETERGSSVPKLLAENTKLQQYEKLRRLVSETDYVEREKLLGTLNFKELAALKEVIQKLPVEAKSEQHSEIGDGNSTATIADAQPATARPQRNLNIALAAPAAIDPQQDARTKPASTVRDAGIPAVPALV
jgi:hypothetical protein